jgi:hypothetical protein
MRQGPDGAMYLLNYAKFQYTKDETTGIFRIEYAGNCKPVVGCMTKTDPGYNPLANFQDSSLCQSVGLRNAESGDAALRIQGRTVRIAAMGRHRIDLYDIAGNRVYAKAGNGPAAYQVDLPQGVYFLKSNFLGADRKMIITREGGGI